MNSISLKMLKAWAHMSPKFLPFADAASPDLPLSRLLRLSLFQVSVGMALVLLVGTLNRVMIVELHVSATLAVAGSDINDISVVGVAVRGRLKVWRRYKR